MVLLRVCNTASGAHRRETGGVPRKFHFLLTLVVLLNLAGTNFVHTDSCLRFQRLWGLCDPVCSNPPKPLAETKWKAAI